MTLLPWEYLWLGFNQLNFPDLFNQVWIASLALLVVLVILYNVRTRALHRRKTRTLEKTAAGEHSRCWSRYPQSW